MDVSYKEHYALRNNFRVTKKFLIAKFDCTTNRFVLRSVCLSISSSAVGLYGLYSLSHGYYDLGYYALKKASFK